MDEYIERETFLKDIEKRYCLPCKEAGKDHNGCMCRACWVDDMCGDVIDAPAADVAPVVRCRDCIYTRKLYGGFVCKYGTCSGCFLREDFFCANGTRKETRKDGDSDALG